MSKQDDSKQLEELIQKVFFQAKRESITPKEVRLNYIIKRCFYEVAFKDLIIFISQLFSTALGITSLFIKAFSSSHK